jgi:hypothetical protein
MLNVEGTRRVDLVEYMSGPEIQDQLAKLDIFNLHG